MQDIYFSSVMNLDSVKRRQERFVVVMETATDPHRSLTCVVWRDNVRLTLTLDITVWHLLIVVMICTILIQVSWAETTCKSCGKASLVMRAAHLFSTTKPLLVNLILWSDFLAFYFIIKIFYWRLISDGKTDASLVKLSFWVVQTIMLLFNIIIIIILM